MSHKPLPRRPAPTLQFELVDDGTWRLDERTPENFTLVVFYRGAHCPICKKYLRSLDRLQEQYAERGVEVVAVSMDSESRARRAVAEWNVQDLPVGYGLEEKTARDWGLYLSRAIKEQEPELFCEPGLFLVEPNGNLYYAAINSAPFARPDLGELLETVDFVLEEDYPARGEVAEGVRELADTPV